MSGDTEDVSPPEKRFKPDKNGTEEEEKESKFCLSRFTVVAVLNNSTRDKFIALRGHFKHAAEQDAVVLLEKTAFPFSMESLQTSFDRDPSDLSAVMTNDIYRKFSLTGVSSINRVNMTVIHPATRKHIDKYATQRMHLVEESPELYGTVVQPYLRSQQFSLDWVYNLLEGRAEVDRVILSDPDFVLALDYKWSGTPLEELHCLAIVKRRDLANLRDLDGNHVELLERILTSGRRCLSERFGVDTSQLRIYLHYPPTFQHLHVHFTHVDADVAGACVDLAHLLPEVIRNLRSFPLFYRERTLTVRLREDSALLQLMTGHPK